MDEEQVKELLKRYVQGNCTEEERALLEQWYLQFNEHEADLTPARINAVKKQVYKELTGGSDRLRRNILLLALAAIAIGALTTLSLKFYHYGTPVKPTGYSAKILPGTNKATLTLGDGKKIDLNVASKGQIAAGPGMNVIKSAEGQLSYNAVGSSASRRLEWHNVTTPKGGQWQVLLSDGTKVWLNNASSLTFPESFENQKERIVQLNGEAYFEVTKDKAHPFIVKTDRQMVRVLGTHFNISGYADDPDVRTTLLEGSVAVSAKNKKISLIPGQQSVLTDKNLSAVHADIEDALAWKNGEFRFSDEDIRSIMRKISRWYNIDVQYQGDIPTGGLNGKISRSTNIGAVLQALETTRTVHFKMEKRRVIVMK